MKKIIFLVLVLSSYNLFAQQVSDAKINIYNQKRSIVEETRIINFIKGIQIIQIENLPDDIIPESVNLTINAEILEKTYYPCLSDVVDYLNQAINKKIKLLNIYEPKMAVQGVLKNVSERSLLLKDSSDKDIYITYPANSDYVVLDSMDRKYTSYIEYKIKSDQAGPQEAKINYQVGGLYWHAEYKAYLNRNNKMDINANIQISNNSKTNYKNSSIKFISSDMNLVDPDMFSQKPMLNDEDDLFISKGIQKEQYIFQHPEKIDLPSISEKFVNFLKLNNVSFTKRNSIFLPRYEETPNKQKVDIVYNFKNNKENNLGMLLPIGSFRIYYHDEDSDILVGEDVIANTIEGEDINIKTGKSFDIVYTLDCSIENIDNENDEVKYNVKVSNPTDKDIEVDIINDYNDLDVVKIKKSTIKPTVTKSSMIFTIPVNAKSSYNFELEMTKTSNY